MIWNFVWPAPHPKYVHPPGTITHFPHLRVISEFWQNFFKTPCVPDGCIYRSAVFVREDPIPNVSFDIIWAEKFFRKFLKILPLNPKGKWTKPVFSRFGPKNQFEVHRNAINRFLRELDLHSKLFNNFDVWHPIGRSRIFVPKIMSFLGLFY